MGRGPTVSATRTTKEIRMNPKRYEGLAAQRVAECTGRPPGASSSHAPAAPAATARSTDRYFTCRFGPGSTAPPRSFVRCDCAFGLERGQPAHDGHGDLEGIGDHVRRPPRWSVASWHPGRSPQDARASVDTRVPTRCRGGLLGLWLHDAHVSPVDTACAFRPLGTSVIRTCPRYPTRPSRGTTGDGHTKPSDPKRRHG
jgi:hypothetical protein